MRHDAMPDRLPPQPGEVIDRSRRFTFTWNGRRHAAYAGDTIASALAAAGVRVFSRSLKYHRPRGLLTADFDDPGCLVEVDGEPNVRGAHRLVRPRHGGAGAERVAVAGVRRQGGQPTPRARVVGGLLLQDVHGSAAALAALREGAAAVLPGWPGPADGSARPI